MARKKDVVEWVKQGEGVLALRPTFVHRFYPDLNRLGQKKLKTRAGQFIPERWIGSSVEAVNPKPMPSGGLSILDGTDASLRDAIKAAPEETLGAALYKKHGPEFRCLVKILDPGEPIVFHLHATDRQVKSMPRNFKGHVFGKDEAYYFLEAPKGPMPYTHVGLYEGVTRKNLVEAVKRGKEYALELSPSFYQEYETGFFVPAGIPHRPGTALTLEIQQPSDVYTLLETHAGGKQMPPEQIHPGFKSLDEAFDLVDMKLAQRVGGIDENRMLPRVEPTSTAGGKVATIFHPETCGKFGGRRLRVSGSLMYKEPRPVVMWIWRGSGTVNGRRIRAGDELFVTHPAATAGVEVVNAGDDIFEAFTFFPVP